MEAGFTEALRRLATRWLVLGGGCTKQGQTSSCRVLLLLLRCCCYPRLLGMFVEAGSAKACSAELHGDLLRGGSAEAGSAEAPRSQLPFKLPSQSFYGVRDAQHAVLATDSQYTYSTRTVQYAVHRALL